MAGFWYLEPEVAGGLGPSTRLDPTTHPPTVSALEYRFGSWLGDDLIESFPVFVATRSMADKITSANLSGVAFRDLAVSKTPEFDELQPGVILPSFVWLVPSGRPGVDDMGLAPDHRLVVSDRALRVLREGQVLHAEIAPWAANAGNAS